MADFYEILGVSRDASSQEIRSAYRRLARLHHPDVNSSAEAAERFAVIAEAYHALSDSHLRRLYDAGQYDARRTQPRPSSREQSRRRAAQVAAYKSRINGIINDMLEAERREARIRSEAIILVVTLFTSTLLVTAARPSVTLVGGYGWTARCALWALCALGVWQLARSLRTMMRHFTYQPELISLMDDRIPQRPFTRQAAWAFLVAGYALSLTVGGCIGKVAFVASSDMFTFLDLLHEACVYPPIAILAVLNLRRFEDFLDRFT
jgi:hypothetical protein